MEARSNKKNLGFSIAIWTSKLSFEAGRHFATQLTIHKLNAEIIYFVWISMQKSKLLLPCHGHEKVLEVKNGKNYQD